MSAIAHEAAELLRPCKVLKIIAVAGCGRKASRIQRQSGPLRNRKIGIKIAPLPFRAYNSCNLLRYRKLHYRKSGSPLGIPTPFRVPVAAELAGQVAQRLLSASKGGNIYGAD
jgi:hypothetical protein